MTDGSTLPRWIRHWNTGVVYEAGVRHDYCDDCKLTCYIEYVVEVSQLLKTKHWYRFLPLALGLAIYEISPAFIKRLLIKLT